MNDTTLQERNSIEFFNEQWYPCSRNVSIEQFFLSGQNGPFLRPLCKFWLYLDDLEFFTRKASLSAVENLANLNRNDPEDAKQSKQNSETENDSNDDVSTISSMNGSGGFDNFTDNQLSILIKNLELKRKQKQQIHQHNPQNTLPPTRMQKVLEPVDLVPEYPKQSRRQPPPVPLRASRATNMDPSHSTIQQLANLGHTAALTCMRNNDSSSEKTDASQSLTSTPSPPLLPPPPYDLNTEAESER